VNLLLQLPSGENPSPFKRMVDQLTQHPASVSAETFDQNEDLDALINISEIENRFGGADQRASRDQDGDIERFVASLIDGALAIRHRNDVPIRRMKPPFENLIRVLSDEQHLALWRHRMTLQRHRCSQRVLNLGGQCNASGRLGHSLRQYRKRKEIRSQIACPYTPLT